MRNPLWAVIQGYMDDPKHRYPPKPADLARETGVSEQVLSKWKSQPTLPSPAQLAKIAEGTGISYERLLAAALSGKRYLPAADGLTLTATIETEGETAQVVVSNRYLEVMKHYGVGDSVSPLQLLQYQREEWQPVSRLGVYVRAETQPLRAVAEHDEKDPLEEAEETERET